MAEGRYEGAISRAASDVSERVPAGRTQKHLDVLRSIGAFADFFCHSLRVGTMSEVVYLVCHSLRVGTMSEVVYLVCHSLRVGTISEVVDLFCHSLRIRTASQFAPFVDKPSKHGITFPERKVISVGGFLAPGFLPLCPQNSESPTFGTLGMLAVTLRRGTQRCDDRAHSARIGQALCDGRVLRRIDELRSPAMRHTERENNSSRAAHIERFPGAAPPARPHFPNSPHPKQKAAGRGVAEQVPAGVATPAPSSSTAA